MLTSIQEKLRSWRPIPAVGIGKHFKLSTIVCALALTTLFHGSALAKDCVSASQRAAFDVRVLQSKLMVAGLICGIRSEYNGFVNRFRPSLRRHGSTLVRYFNETSDGSGQNRLDRYVTALANEASRESNLDRRRFCRDSRRTLTRLDRQTSARLDPRAFSDFVNGSRATADVCRLAAR